MSSDEVIENVVDEPIEATLLEIPEDQIGRALAALQSLDPDGEVSGYFGGSPVFKTSISGSGCKITGLNSDFKCSDSDRS